MVGTEDGEVNTETNVSECVLCHYYYYYYWF